MKHLHLTIFTIILLAVLPVFSQDAAEWVRIESDNKELSVAFPPTNIIDAEKRDFGQRLKIVAFENSVEMTIVFTKEGGAKERIGRMFDSDKSRSETFKIGDFVIRKSEPPVKNGKSFMTSLAIAKDDNFYSLTVNAKTGDELEFARFLYSIRLDGKPLIKQNADNIPPERTVAVRELKTSPEIVEAFARKTGKNKGKITYELARIDDDDSKTSDLTHRAILVERSYPRFPSPFQPGMTTGSIDIKLKVQFLADGQIGDIVVQSEADKMFVNAVIDAVRKTKFVPARKDGKYVDSTLTINYAMRMETSAPILIRR